MTEDKARKLAELVGGEAWPSGGNIWLVKLTNKQGMLVVFSEDMVAEYWDQEGFDQGLILRAVNLVPKPKKERQS
jgi:hypothetical protein